MTVGERDRDVVLKLLTRGRLSRAGKDATIEGPTSSQRRITPLRNGPLTDPDHSRWDIVPPCLRRADRPRSVFETMSPFPQELGRNREKEKPLANESGSEWEIWPLVIFLSAVRSGDRSAFHLLIEAIEKEMRKLSEHIP